MIPKSTPGRGVCHWYTPLRRFQQRFRDSSKYFGILTKISGSQEDFVVQGKISRFHWISLEISAKVYEISVLKEHLDILLSAFTQQNIPIAQEKLVGPTTMKEALTELLILLRLRPGWSIAQKEQLAIAMVLTAMLGGRGGRGMSGQCWLTVTIWRWSKW